MSRLDGYIRETPEALGRLIDAPPAVEPVRAALVGRKLRKIWISGSGTSLFASEIAARIWEEALGIDAEAIGALQFREQVESLYIGPDTLVIAISQTGATNVLVEALSVARARGALSIACTAFPESPLAQAADITLDSRTGPENTPGKTKGFITTTVAVGIVALALADDDWRAPTEALLDKIVATLAATDIAIDDWVMRLKEAKAIWTVGSGRMAPAAVEGGLKILEVAKLPVIGKELEEMMHGQFHAIGEGAGIVFVAGIMSKANRIGDLRRVIDTVNVPVVAIADGQAAAACHDLKWDLVLDTAGVGPFEPLVGAIPLQLLAEKLARARGLDPDQPRYPELYRISGSKSIYAKAAGK
ncbi:SIS domain-containing protein [Rhizobium puerariae]|uniref:Glutamine--fructose-6-phosphate aminotransferase [isomerizing] n=1 Tax=Rhizobium puerariae TaxID=1585791 RepID=A0ABV6AIZ1_9HYPH